MAARDSIEFMLNGRRVSPSNVDPTTLLVDYLHQANVGLTGTKKGCGQGGCGACTVMLTRYDAPSEKLVHASINSCMRPLAALDGMAVTTTEGVGNTRDGVGQVQWAIAANNGSQCGYCTPGWVMTMHSYLAEVAERQGSAPTPEDVQGIFDGNICRCTGYRPILYAMQHFAEGFEPHAEAMTCVIDPAEEPEQNGLIVTPPFPAQWRQPATPVAIRGSRHQWFRPVTLDEAMALVAEHASATNLKLVAGNTSIGVYDLFTEDPFVYIDIGQLDELRCVEFEENELTIGASRTYTDLIAALDDVIGVIEPALAVGLRALHYMAGRTAGHVVRNAASLAGNTMLVLRHINEGAPFPSDMFTAYCMAGVHVSVASTQWQGLQRFPILEYAKVYANDPSVAAGSLIVSYHLPLTEPGEYAQTYKTALRDENSHSILNAGFRTRIDADGVVVAATIVLAGIGPVAFHAEGAQAFLVGQEWSSETLRGLLAAIRFDAQNAINQSQRRMASVPDEGFSDEYRIQLAESFAYKYWIEVAEQLHEEVPPSVASVAIRTPRQVSIGTQNFSSYPAEYPVNEPIIKLGAFMQACGEAEYTHDMALSPRGLHARFVTSAAALADFSYVDHDGVDIEADAIVDVLRERFDGIERYITGTDVPYNNEQFLPSSPPKVAADAPQIADPLFCLGAVTTYGQSIGLVLAEDPVIAEAAAHYVSTKLIRYRSNPQDVLLTIDEAQAADRMFVDAGTDQYYPSHIWKIKRRDSDLEWTGHCGDQLVGDDKCRVTSSRLEVGSQIHFYLETQSAMAVPGEDGTLVVNASTQSPDEVQKLICSTLGIPANKVDVRVTRVGGAYGGKTTRSPRPAAAAAVAAYATGRPVHLAMRRETDTAMIGHRHGVRGDVELAIQTNGADRGKIMGLKADFLMNGGNTYDCSFVMSDVLQLRADTSYMVPNYQTSCDVARTNIASNGAFRSVGAVQAIMAIENAIEAAAVDADIPAEVIRSKSLYELGDTVPDGQLLDHCYLRDVWDYTLTFSDFERRQAQVEEFNRNHRWVKRGISIIPVKYASGYNATFLEQAGALIDVYSEDGSVLVRQGGVDMGQGLRTKITQIAALVLGLPLSYIRVAETDSAVVPNPVSTGASTGSGFNGEAVKKAGAELRTRIEQYVDGLLELHGAEWCTQKGVDYWNYPDGWRTQLRDEHGKPETNHDGSPKTPWQTIVNKANADRVNLSAQTRAAIGGGTGVVGGTGGGDPSPFTFKPGAAVEVVNQFTGYTFSAACTEVEVDILTGETTVLEAHIVYDMGHSLNPAIDIGQVEGAFIQGLGYVTTEQLVWQAEGPDRGVANTLNTWTYKPPAHTGVPVKMHVDLYPREAAGEVSEDPDLLYSAKEVGEPPLVLATSGFIAIKRAILASRTERGIDGWFDMGAPATVQAVRTACAVDASDLVAVVDGCD